jgi:hypothetical protein
MLADMATFERVSLRYVLEKNREAEGCPRFVV